MMSHEALVGPMPRGDEHAVGRTMPQHATTLRAFRQHAGGTAQLAGTSTTIHSRRAGIAAGPLTRGIFYEFWIVGHNPLGDGPESNRVTHAVPVGPSVMSGWLGLPAGVLPTPRSWLAGLSI